MTAEQLNQAILEKVSHLALPPLYRAMLEECCENVVENPQGITDPNTLMLAAVTSLGVCNNMMRGMISGCLQEADIVNINYRGQVFSFDRTSPFPVAPDPAYQGE